MGFENEGLNSMSYEELGQHLVTNQGMISGPVEVLEGSFKAILLLAGPKRMITFRERQGTLGQGDSWGQCGQSGDGEKGHGDDKEEKRERF